ncbi:MAG: hypothetical protein OEM52_10115 [bacterium]|nr:hypothetical protein [bacterium]
MMPQWLEMFGRIDRRIIYLAIAAAVALPLIFPLNLPLAITKNSQSIFDRIEALPESSSVLIAFDFDPTSIPECQPMAIALVRHVMKRGLPLIVYTNYPETGPIADRILENLAKEYNRTYGTDYVNLGFKPGNDALLLSLGSSWTAPFPNDQRGQVTAGMPIFQHCPNYRALSYMVDIAHGATVDFYITIGLAQFGVPLGVGVTAVNVPQYEAYMQTNQLTGMLGGLKGAAEYEKLVGKDGKATRGMDAQSVAHIVIIILILLGNLSILPKWLQKRKSRAEGR